MYSFRPPQAPTDALCMDSCRILARLRLIQQFQSWLDLSALRVYSPSTAVADLWQCLSSGVPLCVLLDLLGAPQASVRLKSPRNTQDRVSCIEHFIESVRILEITGRLPFGEGMRVDDLLNGSTNGFARVLKTVQRVLDALLASYPGLFGAFSSQNNVEYPLYVNTLVSGERNHIIQLDLVMNALTAMSEAAGTFEPCLEGLFVASSRLRDYHCSTLLALEDEVTAGLSSTIQRLTDSLRIQRLDIKTKTMSAYRSIASNCIRLMEYLENTSIQPDMLQYADLLADFVPRIPSRISEYISTFHVMLDKTSPTDRQDFDALCDTMYHLHEIEDSLIESSHSVRTVYATRRLTERGFIWSSLSSAEPGSIILDGIFGVEFSGLRYSLFLYESLLLCCLDLEDAPRKVDGIAFPVHHPVQPWNIGPGLRGSTPLDFAFVIPLSKFQTLQCGPDPLKLSILWRGNGSKDLYHALEFTSTCSDQRDQWMSALESRMPSHASVICHCKVEHEGSSGLEPWSVFDLSSTGNPRPWSVIARKSPQSLLSVNTKDDLDISDAFLSPSLLPTLFRDHEWPVTPLAISTQICVDLGETLPSPDEMELPPTPPPETSDLALEWDPEILPDLTGQIVRKVAYAEGFGGFADVWRCDWLGGPHRGMVAVKVLRYRVESPEKEEKMKRRMHRELEVWRRLRHPHILPLLGVVSDFGPYESMVCPWLENGSIAKHLERFGDILTISDRLNLLAEVASGVEYLHSFGIIHGDITGSNVLINDNGKACLCDFGLSTSLSEFRGSECLTSNIGGAIRWSDIALIREDGDVHEVGITMKSDIYSFGSLMLQVLSGRIPYHYIKSDAQVVLELHNGRRPRKPALSFVSDAQWEVIQLCWDDDPRARPDIAGVLSRIQVLCKTSMEFRRHSA